MGPGLVPASYRIRECLAAPGCQTAAGSGDLCFLPSLDRVYHREADYDGEADHINCP